MSPVAVATRAADLSRPRRIHLVGVGGAGIGAMASVLVAMGHRVSGSDRAESAMVRRVQAEGVRTFVGHRAEQVGEADLVAASTAISEDNPELVEARRRGLPVLRRAELLAAICATRRTLAVAGTHGKTTTSSMLALILTHAGWAPSYLIGGDLVGRGSGAHWEDRSPWLVVEADESDGTFLELGAEAVIVTNVEADHLDYYGDVEHLHQAFVRFVSDAPGPRVVGVDTPGSAALIAAVPTAGSGPAVIGYGRATGADVHLTVMASDGGGSRFSVHHREHLLGTISLGVPGLHFATNACGALALALALGVPFTAARDGLAAYRGVGRRFERRGEWRGVTFVDDYGHLPAEVAATLATARQGPWKRVVTVFQPHRYSRTEQLFEEFGDAFGGADVVVVTGVYSAGEAPRPGVTGKLIADAIRSHHPGAEVHYVEERENVAAAVAALLQPGDLCLSQGAGDITTLAAEIEGRR